LKLKLKVVPGASRSEIVGWLGNVLKLRVREQPEKGKANKALCILLAEELQIPVSDIHVVAGQSSPYKTVELRGINEARVKALLRP
jgi:uncharacterized protein (TIGR00251 family)